jgi:hypothetical protein
MPAGSYSFCSGRRGAAIKPCVPDGAAPARISCKLPARGSRPAHPGGWGRALPRPTPLAPRCAPAAPTPRAPSRAPPRYWPGASRAGRAHPAGPSGVPAERSRVSIAWNVSWAAWERRLVTAQARRQAWPGVGQPAVAPCRRSLGRRRRRGRRCVRRPAAASRRAATWRELPGRRALAPASYARRRRALASASRC